jgi:hypothetical protein
MSADFIASEKHLAADSKAIFGRIQKDMKIWAIRRHTS